jgi:hypothetical protein
LQLLLQWLQCLFWHLCPWPDAFFCGTCGCESYHFDSFNCNFCGAATAQKMHFCSALQSNGESYNLLLTPPSLQQTRCLKNKPGRVPVSVWIKQYLSNMNLNTTRHLNYRRPQATQKERGLSWISEKNIWKT